MVSARRILPKGATSTVSNLLGANVNPRVPSSYNTASSEIYRTVTGAAKKTIAKSVGTSNGRYRTPPPQPVFHTPSPQTALTAFSDSIFMKGDRPRMTLETQLRPQEVMAPSQSYNNESSWFVSSDYEYEEPIGLIWLMTILYVVLLATVIVANVVTFSYYFLNRKTGLITNAYVVSLAFADFLWPFINVPLSVAQLWTPNFVFGSVACRMGPVLQMIFPQVISATICVIAVERYYSVLHPFDSNPLMKRRIAAIIICLTWLLPILANIWLVFAFELVTLGDSDDSSQNDNTIINDDEVLTLCMPRVDNIGFIFPSAQSIKTYQVLQSALVIVVVPAFLFPACYGQIIYSVFKSDVSGAVDFNRRLTQEHRKRVVTFFSLLVQLIHFATWTPIVSFQLLHSFKDYPDLSHGDLVCYKILTLIAASNAAFNSLVYTAVLRSSSSSGVNRAGFRTASNASTFALIAVLANRTRAVAVQIVKYRDTSTPIGSNEISNTTSTSSGQGSGDINRRASLMPTRKEYGSGHVNLGVGSDTEADFRLSPSTEMSLAAMTNQAIRTTKSFYNDDKSSHIASDAIQASLVKSSASYQAIQRNNNMTDNHKIET